jgi:hypothetical protein
VPHLRGVLVLAAKVGYSYLYSLAFLSLEVENGENDETVS